MIDNNSIIVKGIIGEDYTYSEFIDDLRSYNTSKRKNIRIGIDSLGGYIDENDKIYNKILELKKTHTITTYNFGNVMSCASILFVTGDVRIFDFAKGNFLIHSPWTEIEGDASELRKVASDLQKVEDRIALLYAKIGKSDIREIKDVMAEDRNLTPAEVKKFKFATEIKNAELASSQIMHDKKVYAFAALSRGIKMGIERNIEKNNQNNKVHMKIVDFVKTLLKTSEIANLVVTGADGVDYTVTNEDGSEDLKVGSNVTLEGQPYEGQIILADDTVITVEGGVVTKIEQPEEEVKPEEQANTETETETKAEEETPADNTDAIDSLRGKVDELYALLNDLTERVNSIEGKTSEVENAKAEVDELKNKIRNMVSTEQVNPVSQTGEEKKPVFGFKK